MFVYPDNVLKAIAPGGYYHNEIDVQDEFDRLRPYLPPLANSILDIGCGLAAIDVLIANHYRKVTVHLMDGLQPDEPWRGYVEEPEKMKPWNDVHIGFDFVKANTTDCVIASYPCNPSLTIPADVIISSRSWCFHYPVEVYLLLAQRSLNEDGVIIVDIRRRNLRGTELYKYMPGFPDIKVIQESAKSLRVAFRRG